ALTRPEEAAETIPASAGNHVNVKMRHALADPVVDRDERAVRVEARLHHAREKLDAGEERADESSRQIGEKRHVPPRDEKRVAVEDRAMVEEADRNLVLEHDVARRIAADDPTECAVRIRLAGPRSAHDRAITLGRVHQ